MLQWLSSICVPRWLLCSFVFLNMCVKVVTMVQYFTYLHPNIKRQPKKINPSPSVHQHHEDTSLQGSLSKHITYLEPLITTNYNINKSTEQNPSLRKRCTMEPLGHANGVERPPLAKIPHHESNGIDGSSIEGPSIDLWLVTPHLQILFKDTQWTWARCTKTSRSGNFEFCQLLLVCLGMGNMAMPTASPPSMDFQIWPSLA